MSSIVAGGKRKAETDLLAPSGKAGVSPEGKAQRERMNSDATTVGTTDAKMTGKSVMVHNASYATLNGAETMSTIAPEPSSPEKNSDSDDGADRPLGVVATKLRSIYNTMLERSLTLPEDQRLVMYDPHDATEIAKKVGPFTVRLDARRAGKPKAAPAPKVMVCTPFDPTKFNFTKIRNADERLLRTTLAGQPYDFLTNKFPLCTCHTLLVSQDLVAQEMAPKHLAAIQELLGGSTFYAYFNSWGAAASVNHFHMHVIDEKVPLFEASLFRSPMDIEGAASYRIVGHAASHYVLPWANVDAAWNVIERMQKDNVPHNLAFSATHIYIFPRDDTLALTERSLDIYGEKPGGLEMCGIFTVYSQAAYDSLSEGQMCEVLAMNTRSYL